MEENKKSLKMPIIIMVAVLVILLVGAVIYVTNNNKPKNIFMGAIDSVLNVPETETKEIKTINATMGLVININSQDSTIAKIAEYINKAKITINSQIDLEEERELVKLALDYDNEKILDGKISYKKDDYRMYGYIEDLFNKCFAIKLDSSTKEQINIMFEEIKKLSNNNLENEKALLDLLKKSVNNNLKDEYFSQENVEIDVNGEKINTRKSTLTLTSKQFKEVLISIIKDLKDNEEFINCFKDEDREEIKQTLSDLEKDIDSGITENEGEEIKICLYTKGFDSEFIRFEVNIIDQEDELTMSILKTDAENYKLIVTEKLDEETSELLNSTITVKNVNDNTTNITIKVNNEELGELTINLQLSYVINQAIESIDTTNSIDIDKLTEKDQEKIMKNLEKMKIYKIVQKIIEEYSSSMMNDYDTDLEFGIDE